MTFFSTEKIKLMAKKYGRITIYTYLGISVVDLACCIYFVKKGFDVNYLANKIGLNIDKKKLESSPYYKQFGDLALAFLIHKSLIFIRVPATLAIVPMIARRTAGNAGKIL